MKTAKTRARKRVKNKPKRHAQDSQRSPFFRSRVSAGLSLLPSVDGRSAVARIFKSTYETLISHVGGEDVPEPLRLMCRRAAAIESELVNLECRFAEQREFRR